MTTRQMKNDSVTRMVFARKTHPDLSRAEAEARADLAAAVMALDEAEDAQHDRPAQERIYSQEVAHLREDLAAALQAGLDENDQHVVDVISLVHRIHHPRDTQTVLREVLDELGPVVFGAIVLFSIEAQTSLSGDCEVLSRQSVLHKHGLTFSDLRQPADTLHEEYIDEAALDTPDEMARIERIREAIARYKSQQLPLKDTEDQEAAVKHATDAYTRALADLLRGGAAAKKPVVDETSTPDSARARVAEVADVIAARLDDLDPLGLAGILDDEGHLASPTRDAQQQLIGAQAAMAYVKAQALDDRQIVTDGPMVARIKVAHWCDKATSTSTSRASR